MSSTSISLKLHYHIRWSRSGELDWEAHPVRAQAEEAARQLAQPNERYSVEQFGETCSTCAPAVRSFKHAHSSGRST